MMAVVIPVRGKFITFEGLDGCGKMHATGKTCRGFAPARN